MADPSRATNSQKKRASDLDRRRLEAIDALKRITPSQILDVIVRGEMRVAADGFSSGGDAQEIHGKSESSSVESAALYGLPSGKPTDALGNTVDPKPDDWTKHHPKDPIGDALNEIVTSLAESHGGAKRAANLVAYVLDTRIAPTFTYCMGCHREVEGGKADPIRSRYCSACSTRWYEWWGSTDKSNRALEQQRFEAQRGRFEGHQQASCAVCAENEQLSHAS